MYLDIYAMKDRAKARLTGNWPILVVITIIALLVNNADIGNTTSFIRNGVTINVTKSFNTLLQLIVGGPILLGTANLYLDLRANGTARFERFIDGFRRFGDAFILNILTMVLIILWSLLLIVPGIIAAIRYSMAFLIMSENPDVGPKEAIDRSKALMQGHKGEFFNLVVSFIGWAILGIVSFGVGFLYLIPYYNAAKVEFYKELTAGVDPEYVVESLKR